MTLPFSSSRPPKLSVTADQNNRAIQNNTGKFSSGTLERSSNPAVLRSEQYRGHNLGEMKYTNKIPIRAVVYPKDVENITGRKDSAARKYLSRIKKAFAKKEDQFVTIQEFCQYSGIDENIVREYIKT